ncbi:hypothetical protein [Candidatus Paracaedibacter symbiosus]|uniref:hypothetical protein n=1 Tax=Candidatus Paracaedibacter symbiosus TaxID=244582 RepID=UPI000509775F|nr:hypothetical protein [Candidatus Paracaedibacter symbiosus]
MRRVIKVLVVVLGIYPIASRADPSMNDYYTQEYYTQGQALSQNPELKIAGPTDASKVPGYQDPSTLSQTSIKETTIDSQVKKVRQENQEAALIQETYNTRPQFDFDVKADPLFTNADDIIANPEKILEVRGHEQSTEIKVTRHQCTKGYDFFEKRCRLAKVPKQDGTKQEVRTDHVYVKGTKKPFYIKDFHLDSRKEGTTLYPTYLLWFSNDRENPQWKKDATSPSVIESFKVLFNGTDAISGQVFRINTNRIISAKHIKNSDGKS